MKLPTIVISAVALLVVLLAVACAPAATPTPTPTQAPTPTPTRAPVPTSTPTPTSAPVAIAPTATPTTPATGGVREIAIQANSLRFSPSNMTVKPGEKVRFVVTSTDMFHTFTSTVLGVDVSINAGETKTVEATIPTGVAEIPFWCKPHQAAGMMGKLIVEGGHAAGGYTHAYSRGNSHCDARANSHTHARFYASSHCHAHSHHRAHAHGYTCGHRSGQAH